MNLKNRVSGAIRLQQILMVAAAFIAPAATLYFLDQHFDKTTPIFWILFVGFSVIGTKILSFLGRVFSLYLFLNTVNLDDDEVDDEIDEEVETQIREFSLNIVDKSEVIGRFQDTDIHEWIDLKAFDGTIYRAHWDGTQEISPDKTIALALANNCFAIAPGLIYCIHEPIAE